MNSVRLPGGGQAWFVRTGKGRCSGLKPASKRGHVFTAAYLAWVTIVASFVAGGDPGVAALIAAGAVLVASTLLYIVIALRMSAPPETKRKGR